MKPAPQISEAELEVMKILWELKEATSTQIVESLAGISDWKPKTIHTLINRLVGKQAVTASKIDGKSYLYKPMVSAEDYRCQANRSFINKLYNGSMHLMLASFVKDHKLSPEEIAELKRILDEED